MPESRKFKQLDTGFCQCDESISVPLVDSVHDATTSNPAFSLRLNYKKALSSIWPIAWNAGLQNRYPWK